jgi:hypothetical protein
MAATSPAACSMVTPVAVTYNGRLAAPRVHDGCVGGVAERGLGDPDHRYTDFVVQPGAETGPAVRVQVDVAVHDQQIQRLRAVQNGTYRGELTAEEDAGLVRCHVREAGHALVEPARGPGAGYGGGRRSWHATPSGAASGLVRYPATVGVFAAGYGLDWTLAAAAGRRRLGGAPSTPKIAEATRSARRDQILAAALACFARTG